MVRDDLAEVPEVVARLEREAKVLAAIESPNVVRVVGFGVASADDDPKPRAYVAMEALTGRDLGAILADGRALDEARALTFVEGALAGLAAAHAVGVLHRDLKPENVFVAAEGTRAEQVKLLDFGMAKAAGELSAGLFATARGVVVGTPSYVAPEQARGEPIDERADLYAIGAILFECLAGRPPHVGATPEATLLSVLEGATPDLRAFAPRASSAVTRLVRRALAPLPEDRFRSADAMASEVRAARASLQRTDPARGPERFRPIVWQALGAMLLGALVTWLVLALR